MPNTLTSTTKSNWKEQLIDNCKQTIYVKEKRNKFITASIEAILICTCLGGSILYITIPTLKHVESYEKIQGFDPVIALSALVGSFVPMFIVLMPGMYYIPKYNAKLWGYLLQ